MESGNLEGARQALEEGARLFPGDVYLLQRYGTLEAKLGEIDKARELFQKSVMIQPHAPTFVAWAILEEEIGNNALSPLPRAIVETLIESQSPSSGILDLDEDHAGDKLTLDPSLMSRDARAAGNLTYFFDFLLNVFNSPDIRQRTGREGATSLCGGDGGRPSARAPVSCIREHGNGEPLLCASQSVDNS